MDAELNLLDLAADEAGKGPPYALGRRLPTMIALLLRAAGINVRHASATVRLPDGGTGWAVSAGVLDEGKAIELSHRMGPAQLLAFGGLGPPKAKGGELPLTLHVLRREDAQEVLEIDKSFYEEEVAYIAFEVAQALAELLGKADDLADLDQSVALGTHDGKALLMLHEGLDGLAAVEGGVSGSDVCHSVKLLLSTLERDSTSTVAFDHALSALSTHADAAITVTQALELARRLADLLPGNTAAILLVARLLLKQRETKQAKSILVEALRESSRELSHPPLVAGLARVLNSLGEHDEAIRHCQELLDSSETETLEASLEANLREEWGIALAKCSRVKNARTQLEHAVELDPKRPLAWANLGRCHHLLGHVDDASAAYERSLELDPLSWEVARNYAELLVARGDLARAEQLLTLWGTERPDDLMPVLALGELLAGKPQREQDALRLLMSSLEKHDDDPRLHALLGGLLTQLERHEDAERHYRQSLRLAPDDPALMSNLAVVLSHRGELSEAERLARRAVELDPSDLISHKVLAHIRSKN